MVAWFKIALRNLIKNRRRSVITILAIALGFAAVNLFGGFTEYMYRGNREAAILCKSHRTPHGLQEGFLEKGQLDPTRYLLTLEEMRAIEEICKKNPHVLIGYTPVKDIRARQQWEGFDDFCCYGDCPFNHRCFLKENKFRKICTGRVDFGDGKKLR